MARQLIAVAVGDFDADRFEDTYSQPVLDLIERKAAGDTEIVAPPEVMTRGQGRRPHGRARGERARRPRRPAHARTRPGAPAEDDEKPAPAKKRTRKSA
jgi:hypothetical protein